jgi:hypothetical protein
VLEHDRAGVLEDAVEDERERLASGQEPRQFGLARLDRLVPEIAAVKRGAARRDPGVRSTATPSTVSIGTPYRHPKGTPLSDESGR